VEAAAAVTAHGKNYSTLKIVIISQKAGRKIILPAFLLLSAVNLPRINADNVYLRFLLYLFSITLFTTHLILAFCGVPLSRGKSAEGET
jgi:hypothetical protein